MSGQKNKPRFVLDSYAVLTYLKEGPGWQKVKTHLWDAYKKETVLFLNCVNLGEIYYIIYKSYGAVSADRALNMLKSWPLQLISVKEDIAIIAGRMKAENKISYADAYVAATALAKKATILTGDLEFKGLEEIVRIEWLPKNR